MQTARLSALIVAVLVIPMTAAAQESAAPTKKTLTLSGLMLEDYRNMQQNLADAADKMPDDQYGFRPTPEVKPFGQLVAHTALAQFRICAWLKGEANPHKDDKEDATRSKADEIALLKASTAYCDPLIMALKDAVMTDLVDTGDFKAAKGLFPAALNSHGNEMYGTMAVYLRLKGIVPPSTEKEMKMKTKERQTQDR
jgi:hypothetical protein